jgi:hypothetical protein
MQDVRRRIAKTVSQCDSEDEKRLKRPELPQLPCSEGERWTALRPNLGGMTGEYFFLRRCALPKRHNNRVRCIDSSRTRGAPGGRFPAQKLKLPAGIQSVNPPSPLIRPKPEDLVEFRPEPWAEELRTKK